MFLFRIIGTTFVLFGLIVCRAFYSARLFSLFRALVLGFLFSFLFFCGDSSVLSSKGKGRNSYPGLSFMVEKLRFGSKRLVEGST